MPSAEPAYGQVVFTYRDSEGNISSTIPSDTGRYTLIAHVGEGTQDEVGAYSGLDEEVEFTIHPYRVSVPEIMSVEYTGEQIEIPYHDSKETFYGTEVTVYTVTGEPGTKIGDYTATLTLNNSGNFVWSDGSQGTKTVTWRIVSGGVPTYADFAIDDGDEVAVDFDSGVITNLTKNKTYKAEPFPPFIQNIIQKGGLLASLK